MYYYSIPGRYYIHGKLFRRAYKAVKLIEVYYYGKKVFTHVELNKFLDLITLDL